MQELDAFNLQLALIYFKVLCTVFSAVALEHPIIVFQNVH